MKCLFLKFSGIRFRLTQHSPVFAVFQQLLHVHLFFLQTSKGRLEFGRFFARQGHIGDADVCPHVSLHVFTIGPSVFDEVRLCYIC